MSGVPGLALNKVVVKPQSEAKGGNSNMTPRTTGVTIFESLLHGQGRSYLTDAEVNKIEVAALKGKVVGLLFGKLEDGACAAFFPFLAKAYEEIKSDKKAFEIVYVSEDTTNDAFIKSMSGMPWCAIPFSDKEARERIAKKFDIKEVPTLIVMDVAGNVVTKNGVALVRKEGAKAYPFNHEVKTDKKEVEAFEKGVVELFEALDLDGDKVVTKVEVLKRLKTGNVPDKMVDQFADGIMKDVDKDASASLTLAEWSSYFKHLQAKAGGPFSLDGFRMMFGLPPVIKPRLSISAPSGGSSPGPVRTASGSTSGSSQGGHSHAHGQGGHAHATPTQHQQQQSPGTGKPPAVPKKA